MRLRLTKSEVAQFGETGLCEETVEFGDKPDQKLVYALAVTADAQTAKAAFENGRITV